MPQYEILPDAPTAGFELMPDEQAKLSRMDKYKQGVRDPLDGGAQLLTHLLPKSVVDTGNQFNNWLADKTGMVGRIEEGGIDKQIADRETAYQAKRTAAGETGFDGYRMVGNVVNPVNLGLGTAGAVAAPVGLMGRMAIGAGVGAAGSAINPVTSGDYVDEKKKQLATGAIIGGALPGVGAAAGRIISPEIRESVKTLLNEKVTPTIGQIMGGAWQKAEDRATSIPLIGDLISSARSNGLDEFNRAAMARALKPVGGEIPQEVGRDAVASVRTQLSQKYNELLPRLTFRADQQFSQEMARIGQMAQNLAPQEAAKYLAIMKQHLSKMSPNGSMTGETFKIVESALGQDAKKFTSSLDPYQKELGNALQETLQSMRSGLSRSVADPADAAALKAINAGYANYARIKQAAASIGAADGKFTPAQLAAAVRRSDSTAGKRAYSEGTALMQDLTDAGKEALSSKYPDSGTAGRMMGGVLAGGGLGAAALASPKAVAVGSLAALPYLPGGRQLMAALLAKRPELAKPVAEAVKKGSIIAAPGVAPALVSGNGN